MNDSSIVVQGQPCLHYYQFFFLFKGLWLLGFRSDYFVWMIYRLSRFQKFFPLLFGRTGQRGLTSDTFRMNCTLALDMTEHDEVCR